jgi:hypothetical protein
MALDFKSTKGKAQKSSHEAYTYKDGENTIRLFGGILPRYIYWVKGTNNKDIPIECLAFDRDKEKFDNTLEDPVREYFPEAKCGWAYTMNCIATVDGVKKAVVLNLKKKLFEQIMTASEDLGDPTDPTDGWDVVFKKAKNGPLAFNVEYTLNVLRCKKRTLDADEQALITNAMPIDAKFVRQTPADIRALLDKLSKGESEDSAVDTGVDGEAVSDLG